MDKDDGNKPKKFRELIIDYVSKNPFLTLWSVAGIVGGIFGYIHYARIGYIPEIDIKSVGTILFSLALTGVVFTAAFGAIFLVPALYFRSAGRNDPNLIDLSIPEDPYELEIKIRNRRTAGLVIRSSITSLGIYSVVFGVLAWGYQIGPFLVVVGIAVMASMMFFFDKFASLFPFEKKKNNENETEGPIRQFFSRNAELIGATFVWFISFTFVFVFANLSIFSNIKLEFHEKVLCSIGLVFIVLFANLIASIPGISKVDRFAAPLIMGIMASPLMFVLAVPNSNINLEKLVFRQLGLGSMPNTIFFVNSDACLTANLIRANTCSYVEGQKLGIDGKDEKKLGCIIPHLLENRLGSEYLLAFNDEGEKIPGKETKEINSLTIPIQKKDVVQWGFLNNKNLNLMACPAGKKQP
ncbi:MAG: hypothetical protein V4495_19990 [Pseudomonadota bacterium]